MNLRETIRKWWTLEPEANRVPLYQPAAVTNTSELEMESDECWRVMRVEVRLFTKYRVYQATHASDHKAMQDAIDTTIRYFYGPVLGHLEAIKMAARSGDFMSIVNLCDTVEDAILGSNDKSL